MGSTNKPSNIQSTNHNAAALHNRHGRKQVCMKRYSRIGPIEAE